MTTRVMPPGNPASGTATHVNKTVYSATPGQMLDVSDADAQVLAGAGWYVVGSVGPTSARQATVVPTAPVHVDTTIGKTVYSDGVSYRDKDGKLV